MYLCLTPRPHSISRRPSGPSPSPVWCRSWVSGWSTPILVPLSADLHASPSETTMLFTSYLVVTAVAMLITGWVSSASAPRRR